MRVVVANQSEARFYDLEGGVLHATGELQDPLARMHDRELKSDRPGRVFDHAATGMHRRGAVAHHSTGGERSPRRHEAQQFAHRIAAFLEAAPSAIDGIILVAGPPFLGVLRKALPKALRSDVKMEVPKDLINEPAGVLFQYLPHAHAAE